MDQALAEAALAGKAGDVPVGAVILGPHGHTPVSRGRNRRQARGDALAHAEVEALRAAGSWNLEACTLVVTLEPCPMCAGAALASHVGRIVFGAWDPKLGACGSVWDLPRDPHIGASPEVVGGIEEERCAAVLSGFFAKRRG
ncbi:nucleoside deaminase [Bifidobacterium xylocopae]|nr:nucleoside deaminase [Bifidobacterium xylocopae]